MKIRARELRYCAGCGKTVEHIRRSIEDWQCTLCGVQKQRTQTPAEPGARVEPEAKAE